VQATYSYDPYGATTNIGGPNSNLANTNPYRYAGGYFDTATGLYQFGQRYYQPTLGRWTQQDTLNVIGDPANGNRYTYTGDDPINNVDPSGMCDGFFGCAGSVLTTAAEFGGVAGVIGGAIGCTIAGGPFDPPGCTLFGGAGAAIGSTFGFFFGLGYALGSR